MKELTGVLPSISIRLFLRFLHHFTITPAKLAFPFHDNNDDEHLDEDLRLIFTKEIEYLKHHLPNIDVSTETLVKYRRFLKSNSFLMRKQDTGGGGGEVFGSQYIESHARVKNSCQPNCISSYNGRSAYLIAIRDINPEEEVFNYILFSIFYIILFLDYHLLYKHCARSQCETTHLKE